MRIRYFFVEGGIGAGKSTLIATMEQRLRAAGIDNLVVVPEPLERWTDVDGTNLLELFYEDPQRWAYTFQVHAMSTRVTAVRQAIDAFLERRASTDEVDELVVMCERSVFTDRFVFVETLVADGTMSEAERNAYVVAYRYFGAHGYPGEHAGVIYLRSRPETCEQHMRERDRTEEAHVALEYLERLHHQHERAIGNTEAWNGAERLTLDVEQLGRIHEQEEAADTCARILHAFITKERVGEANTTSSSSSS